MKALALAAMLAVAVLPGALAVPAVTLAAAVDSSPVTVYHSDRKQQALRVLREEGLKLRAADGGKLTDEHRAYLDAKLKAIVRGNY